MENLAKIKQRVILYLENQGIKKEDFYKKIASNGGNFRGKSLKSELSGEKIAEILANYPDISADWLLTGKGEMLTPIKKEDEQQEQYLIPLLPISAMAGKLTGFEISITNSDCEKIVSPIKDVDLAVPIKGDSMYPEYPSGSIVLAKKIIEKAYIEWGECYVLDTCNGTVIKKINKSENEDRIVCVSVNKDFAPYEVKYNDIFAFYRVLMVMCRK